MEDGWPSSQTLPLPTLISLFRMQESVQGHRERHGRWLGRCLRPFFRNDHPFALSAKDFLFKHTPGHLPSRHQWCQWPPMESIVTATYFSSHHCSGPLMCFVKKPPTNGRQSPPMGPRGPLTAGACCQVLSPLS